MAKAKHFQCPFCDFNVTSPDENEVMSHVMMHKREHHPDKDVSEQDVRGMMKDVEVPEARS